MNVLYGNIASGNPPLQGGVYQRWEDIRNGLQPMIDRIHAIYETDLARFNETAGENGMRVVMNRQR